MKSVTSKFPVRKNNFIWSLLSLLMLTCCIDLKSQVVLRVADKVSNERLPGVTIKIDSVFTGMTDMNGCITLEKIPGGKRTIEFKMLGYEDLAEQREFPIAVQDTVTIFLTADAEEMEEVEITSTRSSRSISDIPTRVEFIAGEELEEKANMKPGDLRMVLSESTGIQVQQTSATSANASIRIQGLDGRYTQMLKDGFPLYSGYSGGLGLLQTPPLDLKQVEIVKGSTSTLYGGGAIAGLLNLISKTPGPEQELRFMFNGTSAGGSDASGFYSKQFGKVGVTIYSSVNSHAPYDPADIDLTAIPKYFRVTCNPRLFYYPSKKTTITFGLNLAKEERIGGDLHYIAGKGDSIHAYFEKNISDRMSTQFSWTWHYNEKVKVNFKNSLNYFGRKIDQPDNSFDGKQFSTFSELTYSSSGKNSEWIFGVNTWTDDFKENRTDTFPTRGSDQLVAGLFAQNIFRAGDYFHVESGLRADYINRYGPVLLPRISVLFKANHKWSSRLGAGLGYKGPTLFTEETEKIQYRSVLPLQFDSLKTERSYGANWDVNYRTHFFDSKISFSANYLLFYTAVFRSLYLEPQADGTLKLKNNEGRLQSRGMETNLKLGYEDFKLFAGYTLTDAKVYYGDSVKVNVLTPKHKVNLVLIWEQEKFKFGVEGYYFSPQQLSDGGTGVDYWLCGIMGERIWKKISFYLNFENVLNVRQTKNDFIFYGTKTNPVFRDIYAPLDGFIVNGGIKLRL